MYADYFLKFPDEDTANLILYTITPAGETLDMDGNVIPTEPPTPTPNYQNIDVLGIIYDISEDEDIPPTPKDGWHVNVRIVVGSEDPTPFLSYMVHPEPPRRVWAGPMYPVV
jgi:hypothetical protein